MRQNANTPLLNFTKRLAYWRIRFLSGVLDHWRWRLGILVGITFKALTGKPFI
jgi:hypothetical protein